MPPLSKILLDMASVSHYNWRGHVGRFFTSLSHSGAGRGFKKVVVNQGVRSQMRMILIWAD